MSVTTTLDAASKRPSLEKLLDAAPMLRRATRDLEPLLFAQGDDAPPTKVTANGQPLTPALRDELLQRCDAGTLGYCELDVPMLAYAQVDGEDNRNFVSFRTGALRAIGRTGRGKPFLRDHRQGDSLARGGTVLESATETPADGHYQIRQTARLTEPWAIAMYLRGNMTTVSIGWIPTGPVMCSACDAPVLSQCWHFPGDRLAEVVGEDGKKRKVRQSDGEETVRWIYTAAELIETSCVPVPGVPIAEMDQLRATLAAHWPALNSSDEESQPTSLLASKSPLSIAPRSVDPQPETSMADQTDTAKLTSLRKALMAALMLPEAHRAHAAALAAEDAEAFCSKSAADRELDVKAALDADPVVFTGALTGFKVRQSEGARAKQFAEAAEQAAAANKRHEATLAEQAAERDAAEIAMLCKSKLASLPGSDDTHAFIVGALRKSGGTKEQIDAALLALAAAAANVAKQAKAPGASIEASAHDDGPQAAFDALVARHVAEHKCDERTARLAVVKTEQGRQLYNEIENNRKLGRAAVAS